VCLRLQNLHRECYLVACVDKQLCNRSTNQALCCRLAPTLQSSLRAELPATACTR
jgi:hypothetical protein